MENQVKCPKCGSVQISANKKGFSGTKAVAGAVIAGPLGLVAGTHGSGRVNITCLNCGNVFKPGDRQVPVRTPKEGDIYVWIFAIVCFIAAFILMVVHIAKSWK